MLRSACAVSRPCLLEDGELFSSSTLARARRAAARADTAVCVECAVSDLDLARASARRLNLPALAHA